MRTWHAIAALVRDHGRCAMVTVIEAKGSAPREAGARLLVVDGGRYRGTIGGGALEWRALAEAQAVLAGRAPAGRVVPVVLGPDLGQCCGGQVRLLVEVFTIADILEIETWARKEEEGSFSTVLTLGTEKLERAPATGGLVGGPAIDFRDGRLLELFSPVARPVWLFGAGHVGRALVLALAPLPFAVTWIDGRPDAFPGAVPANATARLSPDPAPELDSAPAGAFVLAMTHSHALDFDIVLRALNLGRFPYVGVIGSATKRARFLSRLRQAGIDAGRAASLVCPIGRSSVRSKLPAAIAATTATELLLRDEECAAAELAAVERMTG
jgi:xanthine dehydrogenase accessory factor